MKLINKDFKTLLERKDLKDFKFAFKKTKKMYKRLLSQNRKRVYACLEFLQTFFHLFGFLIIITFIFVSGFFLERGLKNIDEEIVSDIANILSYFVSAYFTSVISVDLIFTSIGDNEYFKRTELSMFLKIKIFGEQSVLYLIVFDLIYFLAVILSQSFKLYISSITNSIFVIFYTSLVLVSFIMFKSKTKIERYLKYLVSTNSIVSNKNSDSIKAFNEIKIITVVDAKMTYKDFYYNALKSNIRFFSSFISLLEKLNEKVNDGQDIIVEQNIVEEYLSNFIKTSKSPYQLITVCTLVKKYIDKILKFKEFLSIKPLHQSINNLLSSLKQLINSDYYGIFKRKFYHKDDKYHYFSDFNNYLQMVNDLSTIQKIVFLIYDLLSKELEEIINQCHESKNPLVKENIDNIKATIISRGKLIDENSLALNAYYDSKIKEAEKFALSIK